MAIKVDNFQILHNMETEKRIKQFTVAENLVVKVEPSKEHEFLMTTEEVANGYGVSGGTVRKHRLEHNEELIEGKHFILVENTEMNGATKSNADRKSAYYKKNSLDQARYRPPRLLHQVRTCEAVSRLGGRLGDLRQRTGR